METNTLKNAVNIGRLIINNYVQAGNIVLDCTVGNGIDTKILAEKVGPTGLVYGFDIQIDAINNTHNLLSKYELRNRVNLINDNHKFVDKYIDNKLDFVMYNLGYLPGGDKSITTKAKSSIISMDKSLNLLVKGGVMLIIAYTGHFGGLEEKIEIEEFLMSLNQFEYSVIKTKFINQINNPPLLFIVEKI